MSQRLPAGTVTLLFADVEGSTRLLHLLGERFGPARSRMRELVRGAAAANGGAEVDWAGDGVFLVFTRAGDAISAATQIQRSLAEEPWPDEEAHRLRVGLHTGEPELGPEGYIGMDVVVAARVCASAHGEQVVVTRATRDLAGGEPFAGASFRPLGHHRLKDVPAPAEVFQLVAPGLREEFPPLKTLSATSLPALHHRLVGRADALRRVEDLLESGSRVVSITGPGGAGKSRLALEVAARAAISRPVHLVGLAPVSDPELVPSAIARAVGARESPGETLLASVANGLNGAGALLLLDNLEHLPGVAIHVAELLDRVPDLQVLVTSRTPLRLSTEHIFPLQPLAIEDAATLFVELAAARGVLLQEDARMSIHEICRRLDGLPLAIELVAARLAVLPPAEILRALGEGLALEMEGPVDLPERQRTLRAAIDWSYGRLSGSERELHGVIAVFADSGSLEDVRAVADAGTTLLRDLEALVGWSLIRSESSDGQLRLSMLETVREHAVEHLRSEGRLEELRRRHAARFRDLALRGGEEDSREHTSWLLRLEADFDNLVAAIDWMLVSGRPEDALRTISALERFWRGHAHATEARRLLAFGLELSSDAPPDLRADALWTAARLATAQSDWEAAAPLLEQARALFSDQQRGRELVFALSELGFIELRRGYAERAAALCDEALTIARKLGDARATSGVLTVLTDVARSQSDHVGAVAFAEEALDLRRTLGDPLLIVDSTYHVGIAAFGAGDLDRSESAFENALALARDADDAIYTAAALCMLGTTGLLKGDLSLVPDRLSESLAIYVDIDDTRSCAECLCALGGLAASTGHPEEAARLWGAADAARGSQPLEYAEPTVEARFMPVLVELLGAERLEALRTEGMHAGYEKTLAELRDVVAFRGAE
jgi:predicted ATPase/class 3 adenylate cyclase